MRDELTDNQQEGQMINEIRRLNEEKRNEFINKTASMEFSTEIDPEILSVSEMDDLMGLSIGESTYIFDIGDVERTK